MFFFKIVLLSLLTMTFGCLDVDITVHLDTDYPPCEDFDAGKPLQDGGLE